MKTDILPPVIKVTHSTPSGWNYRRGGPRRRLAALLRRWADRLDYRGAARHTGYSFTFEQGLGIRFRSDGRGCRLWYLGNDEYERAHRDADSERATLR